MDIGRLGRRSLWIGHCCEVAVVGITDPAGARQVGAKFAGAATAGHRLRRRGDDVRIEAVALGGEALAIEFWNGGRACAKYMGCEGWLMGVDAEHASAGA